jgi:hypothetical protein
VIGQWKNAPDFPIHRLAPAKSPFTIDHDLLVPEQTL